MLLVQPGLGDCRRDGVSQQGHFGRLFRGWCVWFCRTLLPMQLVRCIVHSWINSRRHGACSFRIKPTWWKQASGPQRKPKIWPRTVSERLQHIFCPDNLIPIFPTMPWSHEAKLPRHPRRGAAPEGSASRRPALLAGQSGPRPGPLFRITPGTDFGSSRVRTATASALI